MPFDEHLDKRLRQLKRAYEEQPQVTNVNELVSNIQIKKKKVFFPLTGTVAITALVCMLMFVIPLLNQGQEHSVEIENFSAQPEERELVENEQTMKKDFIYPEGIPEETTLYFIKNEQLNISTYYPEDMIAYNENDKIIFYANFDNYEEKNAYVEIYKLDGDAFRQQKEMIHNVFHDYEIIEKRKEDFVFAFSEQEFGVKKGEFMAITSVVKRGEQFFGVIIHYPELYEEGLLPRAHKIISEMK